MIDNKKIEEAARLNTDKYRNYPTLSDEDRDKVSIYSFMEGAKWMQEEFLKNLWHPADKMPNENNEVICVDKDSQTITYDGIVNWWAFCRTHDVTHWLYIDDLLPKEGGEQ